MQPVPLPAPSTGYSADLLQEPQPDEAGHQQGAAAKDVGLLAPPQVAGARAASLPEAAARVSAFASAHASARSSAQASAPGSSKPVPSTPDTSVGGVLGGASLACSQWQHYRTTEAPLNGAVELLQPCLATAPSSHADQASALAAVGPTGEHVVPPTPPLKPSLMMAGLAEEDAALQLAAGAAGMVVVGLAQYPSCPALAHSSCGPKPPKHHSKTALAALGPAVAHAAGLAAAAPVPLRRWAALCPAVAGCGMQLGGHRRSNAASSAAALVAPRRMGLHPLRWSTAGKPHRVGAPLPARCPGMTLPQPLERAAGRALPLEAAMHIRRPAPV